MIRRRRDDSRRGRRGVSAPRCHECFRAPLVGAATRHILLNMLGGIEAGGTKFVCAVGSGPEDVETATFLTTTPAATVSKVIEFFRSAGGGLRSIGIGSFGPVDLHPSSPTYGHITSTPKAGWGNFDLAGSVRDSLGVPVNFDTDVNAAILGEASWGAARGLSDAIYLTIGTGIGGGAMVRGRVVHGLVHPEVGHLRIPHDLERDPFPGCCPYHGDCLEGLACGPAIEARWGLPAQQLPDSHPAWELEAHYLALGVLNCAVVLSPSRILLGGGVMQRAHLFTMIRKEFKQLINGYVRSRSVDEEVDSYIVPPQLGSRAGVLGALVLADQASELSEPYSAGETARERK